ncbi:glycosyltransferase family 25 protein [Polynucleobacter sp. AM-26B4]|uniref:glycosyltransferase family 25 protein n=1 Tax=Polynucleobacter sp. AM-26B4 TaxID=2689103 RepID=UPI001C0E47B8|nr:glycosyltransferase family 25 protein [Polynucleobacter sp. AM-26B4]
MLSPPLPPIYVLSVKTFTDRISHIQKEMAKHDLKFEFIFEYDIDQISPTDDYQHFSQNSKLSKAAKSITLKHIAAWRKCLEKNHPQILVFEDDVVLDADFPKKVIEILQKIRGIPQKYLIFLGGADTKVPKNFFSNDDYFFKLNMPTAEAYITDLDAVKARLEWLNINKISLPADHATVKIDQDCSIAHYWPKKSLVTQGSVFGLFRTTLDKSRARKSPIINNLIFKWKKFKRRTFPQAYYNFIKIFKQP